MARDGKRKGAETAGFEAIADQVLAGQPGGALPGDAGAAPEALPGGGGVALLDTPVQLSVSMEQLPDLAQVAEGDEVMLTVAGTVTSLENGLVTVEVGQVETAQPATAGPQIPEGLQGSPGEAQFAEAAGVGA